MTTQLEKRYYTRDEYLELEENAEFRSEYWDGEIVPMTGGTDNHNQLAGNLYAYLRFGLKGQNYRIYIADMRLWIPKYKLYTYPDVMLVEGTPQYEQNSKTTLTNPSMIVEVLSRSTQAHDQADKFRFYRSIPAFKEYILIDQYQRYAEQYAKAETGKWVLTEYESTDSILSFATVDFQIAFADLYESVVFEG
jgi:Uma2 family endonuclease